MFHLCTPWVTVRGCRGRETDCVIREVVWEVWLSSALAGIPVPHSRACRGRLGHIRALANSCSPFSFSCVATAFAPFSWARACFSALQRRGRTRRAQAAKEGLREPGKTSLSAPNPPFTLKTQAHTRGMKSFLQSHYHL